MVPQVFNDVIAILNSAVNRSDLAPSYIDFINRAIRDIAEAHSFDQMKTTGTATLTSGSSTVNLPAGFKEFQNGRFPVYAAIGGAAAVPCPIFDRTELERLQGVFMPPLSLIYTQDNGGFQLGLLPPGTAAADWVLSLYYFAYPAVVTDPTQGTALLTYYPNLVLSKTLALIFQAINDPVWETHNQEFLAELQIAAGADLKISTPAPRDDKA